MTKFTSQLLIEKCFIILIAEKHSKHSLVCKQFPVNIPQSFSLNRIQFFDEMHGYCFKVFFCEMLIVLNLQLFVGYCADLINGGDVREWEPQSGTT